MSKPRYNWWGYALNIIRDYPIRKRDYDALHQQKITASASGLPGGGGASRTVENVALRQLPAAEQREYDAVQKAIDITGALQTGDIRLRVVQHTLISGWYNIAGSAMRLGITEEQAKLYRWEFIMTVGYAYGFIDREEYTRQLQRRRRKKQGT